MVPYLLFRSVGGEFAGCFHVRVFHGGTVTLFSRGIFAAYFLLYKPPFPGSLFFPHQRFCVLLPSLASVSGRGGLQFAGHGNRHSTFIGLKNALEINPQRQFREKVRSLEIGG
jgi:hypothetical protein